MSHSVDQFPELRQLLAKLDRAELTKAEEDRLEQLVVEDLAARQFYIEFMFLVGQLHRVDARAVEPPPLPATTKSPVLGFLGEVFRQGRDYFSHPTPFSTLVAVATIGSLLTLLAIWAAPLYRRDNSPRPEPLAQREYVARLARTIDCQWADLQEGPSEGAPLLGQFLQAGRQLELVAGMAEIAFDSGARVVLEGPARFRIESVNAGFLEHGTLTAKVPREAVGFTTGSPVVEVVDLGTEFGLHVDEDGAAEVHVFAGRVAAARCVDGVASAERQVLTQGQAMRFSLDGKSAEQVPLRPERFKRPSPDEPSAEGLVAYWNFDESAIGKAAAIDRCGGASGRFGGAARRTHGLVGAGAARFTGNGQQTVNVGAGGGRFNFSTGLSIEALFTTTWDGQGNREIFRKNDVRPTNRSVLLSLQQPQSIKRDGKGLPWPGISLGITVGGVVSELDVPFDGAEGRPTLEEIADGKTHHVVGVYDSASGRRAVYIDGLLRAADNLGAGKLIASDGSIDAHIGSLDGRHEFFDGLIDEVALYDRALSAAEIAQHFANIRAGRGYFGVSKPDNSNKSSTHGRARK